ncbi:speedy protein A-like isoform X2 [Protopterus annectens]|nr:speedy protein A-like isoform X2 [Protopterus annectens]
MEEDDLDNKFIMIPWALGEKWHESYLGFVKKRMNFFARMKYRSFVSKQCCEKVMHMDPSFWAWRRKRPAYHYGAVRRYLSNDGHPCQSCKKSKFWESDSSGTLSPMNNEIQICPTLTMEPVATFKIQCSGSVSRKRKARISNRLRFSTKNAKAKICRRNVSLTHSSHPLRSRVRDQVRRNLRQRPQIRDTF